MNGHNHEPQPFRGSERNTEQIMTRHNGSVALTDKQTIKNCNRGEVAGLTSTRLATFPEFKKGSCQFLVKECAQYWLTT